MGSVRCKGMGVSGMQRDGPDDPLIFLSLSKFLWISLGYLPE